MFEEFVERYSFLVPVGGGHSSHRELAEVENNISDICPSVCVCTCVCTCVHMCAHVCVCVQEVMAGLVSGALSDKDLAEDSYSLGTSLVFVT